MPGAHHPRHARFQVASLALALLIPGCSSAVEVSLPAQASSTACQAVAKRWPLTVGGHAQVATSADSAAVRAWGEPAIIARCGLAPIGPSTDDCIRVSGIDWVATRLSDGARFTAYGRSPAIEVLVPAAYAPEPLLLPAFTAAVQQIPQGPRRCD